MDVWHNPYRHLLNLRQSLSQDGKPIGFFLSAGCPLSVKMPEGEWPLIPDVKNLTAYINDQFKNDEKYALLLEELEKAGKSKENIEDILSFIRGLLEVAKGGNVRGLTEDDLIKIDADVCKKISGKVNVDLPVEENAYHMLAKWIRSIDRRTPINIFTTNYDLLLEQALDYLEVPYFDGFVGSRRPFFDLKAIENDLIPIHWARLWKIHGSINWYSEIVGTKTKVYRSSEVKEGASKLIYPSHLKYDESRKMPYLALVDQLNRFIRNKSSFLVLTGYSFNDAHLNGAIINALKSNPTAMVLGLMFDSYMVGDNPRYPKAYELALNQHNLNIWTFDKAIIGTNLGSWKVLEKDGEQDEYDQNIKEFASKSEDEEKQEIIVKLGDFLMFAEFLKRTIGTQEEQKNGD